MENFNLIYIVWRFAQKAWTEEKGISAPPKGETDVNFPVENGLKRKR